MVGNGVVSSNKELSRVKINASCRPVLRGIFILLGFGVGVSVWAQDDPNSPRKVAPIDLTGYWVSVVTEDWRWRMVIPPKGDYISVPLNDKGRRAADTWNPETDSNTCKPYGAAGIMHMPTRLHIFWQDDQTLRVDTDHGVQTRLLHFDPSLAAKPIPTLQGDSIAHWGEASIGIDRISFGGERAIGKAQTLKVVTSHLSPGYLRRNGVPYSEHTVVTEYFDRHSAYDEDWITVTTIVRDPEYLTQEFITSSSFKQLPDNLTWHPVPCELT